MDIQSTKRIMVWSMNVRKRFVDCRLFVHAVRIRLTFKFSGPVARGKVSQLFRSNGKWKHARS